MSKLDELIQEYCPDGVEYVPVKDVYQRLRGTPITAAKMKEIDSVEGNVRIFAGGKTVIDAHEKDIPNANITRVPAVLVQSRGVIDVVYYEHPFTFKNEMWAYTHENKTAVKFLYYVLKNNIEKFRKAASGMGSLPQISLKVTENFFIPVPPLPVQREIVRILDNFTLLTAELTAELTARKKQYEFYRDKLLTFDGANAPLLELRSVVKNSCSGSSPTKGNSEYHTNGTIPWIRTQDVCYNEITEVDSYITEKAVAETAAKWIPENCVIVAISGPTAGRCAINKIKATTDQYCLNLEIDETKALEKYIYYCVHSKYDELISRRQGARGDLDSDLVLSLKIPVPALDVQKRLVYVLDHFDAICSDLKIGLPAEMEARQKQYELYRDALLTYIATDKLILKDRKKDESNALIRLCQYILGKVTLAIADVCNISRGKVISKADIRKRAGNYPVFSSQTENNGELGKISSYMFDGEYITWTTDGANAGTVFYRSGKFSITNVCGLLSVVDKSLLMSRYLYYFLEMHAKSYVNAGMGNPKLMSNVMASVRIDIPDLQEQNRIVSILDRFDTLCSDLTSGLPAEIEARKKQYEYYRDKLLTFPPK